MPSRTWFFRLGFSLISAPACLLFAQQETGSITGQILDRVGASIPSAQVTIRNTSNNAAFQASTGQDGFYSAPQLAPGNYSISVTASGFSTVVRPGITVHVNDRLRIDVTLQIGAVTETVQVEGTTPLLQTEDAVAGQVIDNQRITELPLNGRNWLQLATLAPATVTYPGVVDGGTGNSQAVLMNLGGTRTNQNNYLLNGTDNTVFVSSGGAVVYPPVDSLQEFKVQTNNYTADTGRLAGAVINATIKSGSNNLHGSAYEFLRNRNLTARNFFAAPNQSKPQFTRNQFGASIGGPFLRDKLFFFLNYEGTRQRQDQVATRQVFTDAQKAGNFSAQLGAQAGTDALGRAVAAGQIFDPFSVRQAPNGASVRDAFPGNIIPASRINPISAKLMALVPGPNSTGSPNFVRNLSAPRNIDTFVGRVDWIRSEKNSVFGHFVYADQHTSTAPILGLPLDGGNSQFNTSNQRQFGLGWSHVFSPTKLNEFRAGFVRNAGLRLAEQSQIDVNSQFGIPFPDPGPLVRGLAAMTIAGFTQLGTAASTPFFQFINKYELSDSFTSIHRNHTLKFGVRGSLKLFQNQLNNNQGRGVLDFNGVFSRQVGFANTGSAIADFLTGVANTANLGSVTNEKDVGRDVEFYAQDRWRATSKLTITLGVRYEYNPPSWEARDMISSVNWDRGYVNPRVVVPKGQNDTTFALMRNVLFPFIPVERATGLDRGLVKNTYLNFAPRLGIAYQIGPKTVVRTGYGIFYGFPDVVSGAVLTVNPPSKILIGEASNTIEPTLLLDRSIFGSSPFNRALTNPAFFSVRAAEFPPDLTQMYNLSIQHEFRPNWLLEVGYLGNRATRLAVSTQINDARPALPTDTSTPQSRRRISPVLGNLPYLAPQGNSSYNAMTVNLETRFSKGFSFLGNYTWSRALGVAPPVTNAINTTPVLDAFNLRREYSPLEFDVINRVSLTWIYELPFGKGKKFLSRGSRALDHLAGGWQINGISTMQGGFPITPVLGFSLGRTFTNSRPNAIGDPTLTSRQPNDWLNPAAFAVPSNAEIAGGNFHGNAGRGSVRSPGFVNFDFSAGKNFDLREHVRLQFRGEFFNLTNTPNFAIPSAVGLVVGTPTFGRITAAADPRVVQFGLKLLF